MLPFQEFPFFYQDQPKKILFTFAAFCLAWISIMIFIVVLFLLPVTIVSSQLMLPEKLEFHSFVAAQVV